MSSGGRRRHAAPLDAPARVVGVDFGTRSVGLAIADPLQLFAQPLGAYSPTEAIEQLVALHKAEMLVQIVVGWPLLESGEEGEATVRVQQYIRRIRKALPGIDIIKWDERFSTEEAKERLRMQGRSFAKPRIDAAAAGVILQDYLDERPALV